MNTPNRGVSDTDGTWLKEWGTDSTKGYQAQLQRSGNSAGSEGREDVQQAKNAGKGSSGWGNGMSLMVELWSSVYTQYNLYI